MFGFSRKHEQYAMCVSHCKSFFTNSFNKQICVVWELIFDLSRLGRHWPSCLKVTGLATCLNIIYMIQKRVIHVFCDKEARAKWYILDGYRGVVWQRWILKVIYIYIWSDLFCKLELKTSTNERSLTTNKYKTE